MQSVLGDAALVEIARRKPGLARGARTKIRGLGGGDRRPARARNCSRRSAAAASGRPTRRRAPPVAAPEPDDAPLDRARRGARAGPRARGRARLRAARDARRPAGDRRRRAHRAGEADVRTLQGWRRELAGAELLELLGGGSSLSVAGSGADIRVRIEPSGGPG